MIEFDWGNNKEDSKIVFKIFDIENKVRYNYKLSYYDLSYNNILSNNPACEQFIYHKKLTLGEYLEYMFSNGSIFLTIIIALLIFVFLLLIIIYYIGIIIGCLHYIFGYYFLKKNKVHKVNNTIKYRYIDNTQSTSVIKHNKRN